MAIWTWMWRLLWGASFFVLGLLVARSQWGADLAERSSQGLRQTRQAALSTVADWADLE